MSALSKVFFWGMFISFLGCLPLSTLNVTAMQIGIQESIADALYFAFGCLLVEMLYVRISLVGISWVRRQAKLMKAMEWVTFAIILALAVGSFIAAAGNGNGEQNAVLKNNLHRFVLGMLMSAVNPAQIPFWFGWSTVLFTKKILVAENRFFNWYIVGIGLGTLIGNSLFIFGGQWLVLRIAGAQQYFNWVIGCIFSITAIIQLIKIRLQKNVVPAMAAEEQKP
ncbi:MAG TPA: LysE family transporter [Ferruginibacter sp.]|nr:LysE family transporter [Ferruginibacter sp.]HMP21296.1 LysE family transporter [Ferruginibacter sp.]